MRTPITPVCSASFVMYAFLILAIAIIEPIASVDTTDTLQNKIGVNKEVLMISPAHFPHISAILSDQGHLFQQPIVSAFFSSDTSTLILFSIDSQLNPQKSIIPLSNHLLKLLVDTNSQKSTKKKLTESENISQAAQDNQQTGRVYLMLHTVLKASFLYPINYSTVFPDAKTSTITGISLLTFGGSLYGSYLFTKNMALGYGKVAMINLTGEMTGLVLPFLISEFNSGSTVQSTYQPRYSSATFQKSISWLRMLGYPVGIFAGSKINITGIHEYGNVSIMRTFGWSGLLYGYLLPQYISSMKGQDYHAVSAGLSLAAIPAGFYLGHRLTHDKSYSSGRSVFIAWSAIFGSLSGFVTPLLFYESYDDWQKVKQFVTTTTLLGHVAGTYLGFNYHQEKPYNLLQGIFITTSGFIGAGIGASVPLLGDSDDRRFFILSMAAGLWSGFLCGEYLSNSLFEKSSHDIRSSVSFNSASFALVPLLVLNKSASRTQEHYVPLPNIPIMTITF